MSAEVGGALSVAAVKLTPIAGVALLVVFLILRGRRLARPAQIGVLLVGCGLLIYGVGLVELPDLKTIIEDLGSRLGAWTYLVVGLMAFFETGAFVGLIAPGETFMVFGGVVAGQGAVSLIGLIGIGWFCAVLGDVVSFWAGHTLGRGFIDRHGSRFRVTPERLAVVEGFFDRHGGKAVLLGRFMGLVRAVSPFLAGTSAMRFSRFLPYSILGAGAWASILLVLGYIFWRSFDQVLHYAEQGIFGLAVALSVVAGIWYFRVAEHRHRIVAAASDALSHRELRWLAVIVRPVIRYGRGPLRFLISRFTSGRLGLEVTTLLGVIAVGIYAFIGYGLALRDTVVTRGDIEAARIATSVHTDWLEAIAKIVTYLGSGWVLLPLLIGAGVLVARRSVVYACALLTGAAATTISVQIAKTLFDRARPEDSLISTTGAAFPSGHAAAAIAWVAIVVAVLVIGRRRAIGHSALIVTVAVVVAVLVGLTRIYLRAHYFSDVVAGWGLGAAIYAFCGLVAVVGLHLRQNERIDE